VQIILILVPKAKTAGTKTKRFPANFSADFSFKGLKPKDLNT
jgi:hypothetical protein